MDKNSGLLAHPRHYIYISILHSLSPILVRSKSYIPDYEMIKYVQVHTMFLITYYINYTFLHANRP